ncbi:MAG: 50S ribosomal protein L10 [Roseiflexaceae bacterium]|nr:50S ribosomal protein L10 [Roseiflexus sp.]MDW8146732.1 50S ribosomal protein L10 [Roseiflexaceae bacterium]MDW8234459.1 50S ribosomal protein L10 [Roseiflexaceae bacterium]
MPTQRKIEAVADLKQRLKRMQVTVVADYRGLSVADMTDLRKKLRESGAELMVVKNTLTMIAARETGHEAIESLLTGPTALAFAYDDVPKFVKAINEFNRGPKKITVRGGLLGTTLLKENVLDVVANLPTKEEVRAQVLGGLTAPVTGLAGVIAAPINNIVNLLDATSKSILYAIQARVDQLQSASTS